MSNLITIHSIESNESHPLTLDEAKSKINLCLGISRNSKKKMNELKSQLAVFKGQIQKEKVLKEKMDIIKTNWDGKIKRLGFCPEENFKIKIKTIEGDYYLQFPSDTLVKYES